MTAPIAMTREELAADKIAEQWVRNHGGRRLFDEKFEEIARLIDCEVSDRIGNLDLCEIADQWEYDLELTGEDFRRLRGEIPGWVSAHAAAYGRRD
jgi:hypothetical protein